MKSQAPQRLGPTPSTRIKRHPDRGSYERATVEAIIDEALYCHVAFVADGQAMCLPTAHARRGGDLYLHGAVSNRALRAVEGARCSATFTLVDGLVFATRAFAHSMNYRSAVVFGRAQRVEDPEHKREALAALLDHIAPGRSAEVPPPTEEELLATAVVRLRIEEASAKQRSGPPATEADASRQTWSGELSLHLGVRAALPASAAARTLGVSPAVGRRMQRHGAWAPLEQRVGPYVLSSDPSRVDVASVHAFLSQQAYWARGASLSQVQDSLRHALNFGAYLQGEQIGFARVVSDGARFAYLADVFVLPEHRGRGVAKALVKFALEHPALREVPRCLLGTRDAHALYAPFGFAPTRAGQFMLRNLPGPTRTDG